MLRPSNLPEGTLHETETLAVHAGYSPDPTTRAVAVPIYQTTSYAFDDTQHGADLFDLKVPGNIYTRIMNPTNDVLEQRVAALEGGVGALAVASGMAAITYAIQTVAEAGDNIVSVAKLYGGTYNLLAHTLPRIGIQARFAAHDDISALEALIDERTKAVFCETIGNPAGNIIDLQALADAAHRHGVPLIVDNTVATPVLCRPFEHGADIVVHSLTKYMGGHGTSIGGIVVDSGRFDWAANKSRFPLLNTPDPSYHGVTYTEALRTRRLHRPLPGSTAAQHGRGALAVQRLPHPPRPGDPGAAHGAPLRQRPRRGPLPAAASAGGLGEIRRPRRQPRARPGPALPGGRPAAILSFGIQGGSAAGARFIDALKLVVRLVNIGDAKSLACHPASTTHRQLNAEELARAGVSDDMVRLSIGIEHIDDILADLDQALAAAAR